MSAQRYELISRPINRLKYITDILEKKKKNEIFEFINKKNKNNFEFIFNVNKNTS